MRLRRGESVTLVLLDWPDLRDLRKELRARVGDAFSSASSLLGGFEEERKGKPDNASRVKAVDGLVDFAEASQ